MTSRETLEYIKKLNKYINDNPEIVRMEIDIDLINALEQAQKDLELLNLFKKYFAGVVQEKGSGCLFINMKELEKNDDLEVFLKLFREKLFKE